MELARQHVFETLTHLVAVPDPRQPVTSIGDVDVIDLTGDVEQLLQHRQWQHDGGGIADDAARHDVAHGEAIALAGPVFGIQGDGVARPREQQLCQSAVQIQLVWRERAGRLWCTPRGAQIAQRPRM